MIKWDCGNSSSISDCLEKFSSVLVQINLFYLHWNRTGAFRKWITRKSLPSMHTFLHVNAQEHLSFHSFKSSLIVIYNCCWNSKWSWQKKMGKRNDKKWKFYPIKKCQIHKKTILARMQYGKRMLGVREETKTSQNWIISYWCKANYKKKVSLSNV